MKTAYQQIHNIMILSDEMKPLKYFTNNSCLTEQYAFGTIEKQYYRARGDVLRERALEDLIETQKVDKFYTQMQFLAAMVIALVILVSIFK